MRIEISTTAEATIIKIFNESQGQPPKPCLAVQPAGQVIIGPTPVMPVIVKTQAPVQELKKRAGKIDPARLARMLVIVDEHPDIKIMELARTFAAEFNISPITARLHVRKFVKKELLTVEDHKKYKALKLSEAGRALLVSSPPLLPIGEPVSVIEAPASAKNCEQQQPEDLSTTPQAPGPAVTTTEPPGMDSVLEEIILRKCAAPRTRADFIAQMAARTSRDPMTIDHAIDRLMERGLIQPYNTLKIVASS